LIVLLSGLLAHQASAAVLSVGPKGRFPTIQSASLAARDGDEIVIAAGDYRADTAVWFQDRLTIRAEGGPVRLWVDGVSAERKAIWVVRGGNIRVEGIEFHQAHVPDRNGAGIRFERGQLLIRNCRFLDNENGILTADDAAASLTIQDSEFGRNGDGSGKTHNLYVGHIARLEVTGSYFHHANMGHLLKSRAAHNLIAWNRLDDGEEGRASYELEFPDGGEAQVIGNLIRQSSTTQNRTLISYGAESTVYKDNRLLLMHNTLVSEAGGDFLVVRKGAPQLAAWNNVLLGTAEWKLPQPAIESGTAKAVASDFPGLTRGDYRPRSTASWLGKAPTLPTGAPRLQYQHRFPLGLETLAMPATTAGYLQPIR